MKVAQFITDIARPSRPMPEPYRQLCVLEPALGELWADAIYYRDYWERYPAKRRRGMAASWHTISTTLIGLVGPLREDHDDILGSMKAYECASRALFDVMGV